ncbi:MAG: hypothetical protein KDK05_14750 [Candidatus Competibacteraceae bacterium]|nr:hypothetical protein [Candidatus Competibacteraceae bacterium]
MSQTTLDAEHQLSLLRHDNRQASDILNRALQINEQVATGDKSTVMLLTAAEHLRDALKLIDTGVTQQ